MRKVLNVKEVKDYLSVSESTIRKLVREKKIPYFRVASKILFDQEKIDQWIGCQSNDDKVKIK
ncbi:MAG: helix-turn-helix domain-containing protein [Bacilli bacterium]|nr:helix-turn-helix domain-containing protein [Bacilli bacterium]